MQQSGSWPRTQWCFPWSEARGQCTVHPDREEAECRLKKSALRIQRSDIESATVQWAPEGSESPGGLGSCSPGQAFSDSFGQALHQGNEATEILAGAPGAARSLRRRALRSAEGRQGAGAAPPGERVPSRLGAAGYAPAGPACIRWEAGCSFHPISCTGGQGRGNGLLAAKSQRPLTGYQRKLDLEW